MCKVEARTRSGTRLHPPRSNAGLAPASMHRGPGGLNMARLQILRHREPTGRFVPETRAFTAGGRTQTREARFRSRRHGSRRGSGVQTVRAGQLPPEALQDFQQLLAVRREDVARQRAPAEHL